MKDTRAEVERILDFLASMPRGVTTATTKVTRDLLLQTDGCMLVGGTLYEIKAESLGAGVFRLSLQHRQYVSRETKGESQ